jgi:uncharacterized protein
MHRKDIALAQCEIKFSSSNPREFEGYASVFGGVDSYGDTILRGAYADTLKNRRSPVLMLYGHNPGRVIGKWMDLAEDDIGLRGRGELTPGHSDAEDVYASLRHGSISGLSIGYRVPEGGEQRSADGRTRTLSRIDLVEISVVSMPADDAARIDLASVKQMLDECSTTREVEEFLRDAGGFSRSSAKAIVARVRSVSQREAEETPDANGKAFDLSAMRSLSFNLKRS